MLFGFSFRLFGRHKDCLVCEELGFVLDLKGAIEDDLLRKSSFLTPDGVSAKWVVDTSTFLMNYFLVTRYGP